MTTNTQITTLPEAELHLYRAGAVVFHEGANMVEGKKLLEICGFTWQGTEGRDNSKRVLDRQVERHNFVEGQDFTVTIASDGRIRRSIYHFNMNASNHVLLAAMTDEGKAARQEAIEMKVEQQQPVIDLAALAAIAASLVPAAQALTTSLGEVRGRVESIEETVGTVQETVETVVEKVAAIYSNDLPEDCVSVSQHLSTSVRWLSDAKKRSALSNAEWPYTTYDTYRNGTKVEAKAYFEYSSEKEQTIVEFFEDIKKEVKPYNKSKVYYVHPLINGKFMIL